MMFLELDKSSKQSPLAQAETNGRFSLYFLILDLLQVTFIYIFTNARSFTSRNGTMNECLLFLSHHYFAKCLRSGSRLNSEKKSVSKKRRKSGDFHYFVMSALISTWFRTRTCDTICGKMVAFLLACLILSFGSKAL